MHAQLAVVSGMPMHHGDRSLHAQSTVSDCVGQSHEPTMT